jgi:hypothetical protein
VQGRFEHAAMEDDGGDDEEAEKDNLHQEATQDHGLAHLRLVGGFGCG